MNVLNLGSQTLSLGEFRHNPDGGLILVDFREKSLLTDPAQDNSRIKKIRDTIAYFCKTHQLKPGSKIDYCLSAQDTILQFATLPGTTADDISAIIELEAQQIIPQPLDQVVWDYQTLDSAGKGIWNVVFAAIKSTHLQEITQAITANHLENGIIDVAAIALYNAFRFNYSTPSTSALLVDIGANTTNLLFIEGKKVFSQHIAVGGHHITEALAKELSTSFEEAETLKTQPELLPDDKNDPIHTVLSALAHQTFARIYSGITQALDTFRKEHNGVAPTKVYLCGGTASFPDITRYFTEKLSLPVELFNPLQNIVLANDEIAKTVAGREHTMGKLIGTALRSIDNCPIELDLNQSVAAKKAAATRPKSYRSLATACLALTLIIISLYYQQATTVTYKALAPIDQQIRKAEDIAKQMDQAIAFQRQLQATATPVLLAIEQREIWPKIINELTAALPPHFIWITTLTPLSNGTPIPFATDQTIIPYPAKHPSKKSPTSSAPKSDQANLDKTTITAIQIEGLYLENPEGAIVVDNFANNLAGSSVFSFTGKTNDVIKQRSTPDGSHWAYPYRLVLNLSKPITF